MVDLDISETTVEVRVVKMRVHLVKVTSRRGYQLVCGGRLVLECRDGVKTPHPELPEYKASDFPVNLYRWVDGKYADVAVTLADRKRPLGPVRACTLLLTACSQEAVKALAESQGRAKTAIVMILLNLPANEAEDRLAAAQGYVAAVLKEAAHGL